jgi:hypothetical protein
MHDELAKHSELIWAATELTKAWVGNNKVSPEDIVNAFNNILKGIHPAVKTSAEDIKS